jgi:hypothetical protein
VRAALRTIVLVAEFELAEYAESGLCSPWQHHNIDPANKYDATAK